MWIDDVTFQPHLRAGKPVPRPPGCPTPCHKCPKIPAGEPPIRESARELDERLRKTWRHYLGCKAVGRFPLQSWGEDELVLQHARLLAEVERLHKEAQGRQLEMTLIQATALTAATGGRR